MMGHRPDRFGEPQPRQQAAKFRLKPAVLGLYCRLRALTQHSADIAVSLGTSAAAVFPRALLPPRTPPRPGTQLRGGSDGVGARSQFGHDLLRRHGADSRNLA